MFVSQVLECGEERLLALTEVERVKALVAQLVKLLRAQRDSALPVSQLLNEYSKTFGYSLRLQDYDAATLPVLLNKLCHVVKVTSLPPRSQPHFLPDHGSAADFWHISLSVSLSRWWTFPKGKRCS